MSQDISLHIFENLRYIFRELLSVIASISQNIAQSQYFVVLMQ